MPSYIAPGGVHLIIDPIWMFAVPTLSFVLFDQNKKFVRLDEYCFRSLLEVFVLVPIWSVVLTLICLGCGFFDTAFFFEMGGRGSC